MGLKNYARDIRLCGDLTSRHQLDYGHCCNKCGFGGSDGHTLGRDPPEVAAFNEAMSDPIKLDAPSGSGDPDHPFLGQKRHLFDLPNELLAVITDFMEEETLFLATRAWNCLIRLLQS